MIQPHMSDVSGCKGLIHKLIATKEVPKKALKKSEASTGFKPMTSVIPVCELLYQLSYEA